MKQARESCGLLRFASLLSIFTTARSQQFLPCALGVTSRTVSNSAQAADLTDALLCSGGQFEVTWVGEVLLNRPLAVSDGTSLKVTGSSSGESVVDGGAQYQLFNVSGGSKLELQGLSLVNGASSSGGGAVGLSGSSSLGSADCSFKNNSATVGDGGAIYASDGSSVIIEGETSFADNSAADDGGAVCVVSSTVTVEGEATFSGNNAADNGGAIYVLLYDNSTSTVGGNTTFAENSAADYGGAIWILGTVSTEGETTFSDNNAGLSGGAIYVYEPSTVTLGGESAFVNNNALERGGAIYVSLDSNVAIGGETTFAHNSAALYGGAVYVTDSNVTIGGETAFADNTAEASGGAVYVGWSNVTIGGETTFADNTAELSGGAVFADQSTVSIGGETAFAGNTAQDDGGAIFVDSSCTVTIGGETTFVNNGAATDGGAIFVYSASNVTLGGETFFADNTAEDDGGALSVWLSGNVAITGETAFVNNSAEDNGGAVHVFGGDGEVTIGGETTFANNGAENGGGALYVSGGSIVLAEETTFVNNGALYGGAIRVFSGGNVIVGGETTFVGNNALGDGGAVFGSSGGVVLVAQETTFVNNSADGYGGAINIFNNCSVAIGGETTFTGNSASEDGGAVSVRLDSNVAVRGKTTFVNNGALGTGGALYVYDNSSGTIRGETTFANNSALERGGAIYVTSDCNMTIRGETVLADNSAAEDGGAMYCQESTCVIDALNASFSNNSAGGNGGAVSAAAGATLSVGGGVLLQYNTAGNNGGAIFSFGGTITTEDGSTFTSNTAVAGAGGGVYCSSCVANFLGTVFTANEAVWGGGLALFSTGSAWSDTEPDTSGPANTTNCVFGHNSATDGGGIYSAASYDIIRDCLFEANFAEGSGGAYLHSGVAVDLERCTFVGNKAGEEGLAVLSLGIAENISDVVFDSNTFYCSPGTYGYELDESGAKMSDTCRFDVVCARCASSCEEAPPTANVVNSTSIPTCQPMMTGANSTSMAGVTLQTLELERGYFRTSSTSQDVLECHRAEACIGGNDASHYCAAGYRGAYCSVCEEGYGSGYQYMCSSCVDQDKRFAATATAMLVVALLVVALAIADLVAVVEQGDTASSWNKRLQLYRNRIVEAIPLTAIKIVLVAWQIITQFTQVVDVVYPDVLEKFLSVLNLVNFDLGLVPSISCVVNINFYGRLLFATITPLASLGALGLTYTVARSRNSHSPAALQAVKGKHLSVALFVMFVIYSSVSFTVFQTFGCERLDDGVNYLRADYSLTCSTSAHTAWMAYAGLMICVYPVGIPAVFAWWLVSNRRDLVKVGSGDSSASDRLQPMRNLWEPYKPRRYYYEVIEFGRRIVLTGLGVFLFPGSAAQVALEVIFAAVFIAVSDVLSPFADSMDAWLYRSGMWVVYLAMFLALLIKVDVSDEDSQSQQIFAKLLIAANAGLVLAVVAQAVVSVRKGLGVAARDLPVAAQSSRTMGFAEICDGERDDDDKGDT